MAEKFPVTAAVRVLRQNKVVFEPFLYRYEEKGGTAASAAALGVDQHQVIKTLVFEDDHKQALVVLMHGDCEVSLKGLARDLSKKVISPCKPDVAARHSGYQLGGTSPFGTKKHMPVYMEKTILDLDRVWINGGKRGFLVALVPGEIARVLGTHVISAAIQP